MKIKIENFKRKIILTILVVVIISLIGIAVHFVKEYYNSESGKTKIYARELGDTITLEGNKEIIAITKYDLNKDGTEDYVVLLGEPKYEEVDTTKVQIFKSLSSNLEMYNNISVEYVNGSDRTSYRYDTKKTYAKDVCVTTFDNGNFVYVQVSDTSGNVALLRLNEEKLEDIIANTFGEKQFVGYTIEGKFDETDGVKVVLTLDNYGKEYLAKRDETYTIIYTDTPVNSSNYRLTYMANKFSKFEIVQTEDKFKTYLVCTQYILYSNEDSLEKNHGCIKSKFEIKDEGKIEFYTVEVEK